MVIWLIGISGAGKTTLGKRLKQHFDNQEIKSYMIDGDLVRDFFDNDLGYSKEDRILNIKRIILSAYMLEQNGIIPIICNISPFEEVRKMARVKFHDYHEIYLSKDINIAKKDDIKGIYKNHIAKTAVVGLDIEFEIPKNYDLKINTDKEELETSFNKILKYLDRK